MYWSVWPIMNFEENSFFRNNIKFSQSTVISQKSCNSSEPLQKHKIPHNFGTRNFFNRRGYYLDHLYERSNHLRRSIFLTVCSSYLFRSYSRGNFSQQNWRSIFFYLESSVFNLRQKVHFCISSISEVCLRNLKLYPCSFRVNCNSDSSFLSDAI